VTPKPNQMLMFGVLPLSQKNGTEENTCEQKRKRGRSNSERLHVTGECRSGDTD